MPIEIDVLERRLDAETACAMVRFQVNEGVYYYRLPASCLADRNEGLLAVALLPAMSAGQAIRLKGSLSQSFLHNLATIQDIFHCWNESFQRIPVEPTSARSDSGTDLRGVACFFSGGVDSFYTVLKHHEEITHLVLIHGFDVPLEQTELRHHVARTLREAAEALGKPLLEIETDVRRLSALPMRWEFTHGAALASVAHQLAGLCHKVYIPTSHSYDDLVPWGSHPLLDPLWSSEALEIVHDGCEARRVDKVARIIEHEAVQRSLRVCWQNPDGAYNCGRCEKCLRTMVSLRIAGKLERCRTFPQALDLEAVAHPTCFSSSAVAFTLENLRALQERDDDPALTRALQASLTYPRTLGYQFRRVYRRLHRDASRLRIPHA